MAKDRGSEIAVTLWVFVGLSWFFVFLRFIVRSCITRSWKWDDSLLAVSLALYTLYGAIGLRSVKFGSGQHTDQVSLEEVSKALQAWWFDEMLYVLTTFFVRLSISVFLLRLSTRSLHKKIIYATQATLVTFTLLLTTLVLCSCIDANIVSGVSIAHSAVGFAVDWTLGVLPIWVMWDVKISIRLKFLVASVLSLGLLAGIATLVRIPLIKNLAGADDFLYATTDVAIWSTIEPGLGIIAFSGATLRPLLRYFFPSTFCSLSPAESIGQHIQPYRTTYTDRPHYHFNKNLNANKKSSIYRDSNSTYKTFDKDLRASSYPSPTSTVFDSTRSSQITVGSFTGKESYASMSTIREAMISGFGIREEDEETIIGEEREGDGKNKSIGVQLMGKEVVNVDEEMDIGTIGMGPGRSLTNSVVEPTDEIEWPLRRGSQSTETLRNSKTSQKEWPPRTRSVSIRTLISPRRSREVSTKDFSDIV
ncbi:hypothetical protein EYC84_002580 [Monilinia fructicola]|uniref:Rhodopsin domain-containing protein n=1 Tax=Monilinia fructicola TaxID=38448 RepID=A0A5M9JLY8_MONFR|nr:hypothetical protein EYC84_002580 [Monilinia fructicola]